MLEKLENGSVVLYEGELYKIMYIYSSGYCEIVNQDSKKVELVKSKELQTFNQTKPLQLLEI